MVDVFDVEQRVRKLIERPETQLRNVQRKRIPRRAGRRVRLDMPGGMLEFVDKGSSNMHRLGQVEIQRLPDVLFRKRRADGRFHLARLGLAFNCRRSAEKYTASMRPTGLASTPSSKYCRN